ncbi:hypothetical protein [Engelhardtia mirabilis]|uniref:purine-nucleoside phosphorylase n=1 Tax=Engelhardtia mirabilis TaxID=2528011 RepID=A0A518BJV1_9BACT|nr:Purine nucleoside phosphorylase 1 [Planctomycetes bacterium Pla133]QDV01550.1 Purine nucleoside phosphorylase 1 [Planctomycetes bacterium Pla86]
MIASPPNLDDSVERLRAQLDEHDVPAPRALLLMATGVGLLPERCSASTSVPLAELDGVPAPWTTTTLVAGRLGPLPVWVLDDLSGEALDDGGPDWRRALPVWLAAACGAQVMVHVSAGVALGTGAAARASGLALASDHINLSGRSPLTGLGTTTLGPLFPDQTTVHDRELRHAALEVCTENGIEAREAVVACTAGPSLDTPAECRYFAKAGADVAVQSAAWPYIAAAHAGLSSVAIVALAASAEERVDLRRILERAERSAPAIEELIVHLAGPIARQTDHDEGLGTPRPRRS